MNRMLFNQGGQPVYLDDLAVLQSGALDSIEKLLSSLGGDMTQEILFLKKPTMTYSGTKVTTTEGIVWVKNYGIMVLAAVSSLDLGDDGKAYVQIITTDEEVRTFEDGQSRACKQEVVAQLSATAAGTSYLYSSISDLITVLTAKIDEASKTNYTSVDVTWQNGYSGTVEVKSIYGGYRYHIIASSSNSSWESTGAILCSGAFHSGISNLFLTGGSSEGQDKPHYLILDSADGYIYINKLSGSLSEPSLTNIDVTFDILIYELPKTQIEE